MGVDFVCRPNPARPREEEQDFPSPCQSRVLSFRTLTQANMCHWIRLLVVLATATGAMSSQHFFQQHAAQDSESVRSAPDAMVNSTENLIFWSVSSLLQQWPNTRYINGMAMFQPKPTVQCVDVR